MADVNGFDPVPWFVADGAEHTAEVFRTTLWLATGGGEGVVAPTDLKVRALDVAAGQVRIDPGACVMPNRQAGARSESYGGRAPLQSLVDIPQTDSSGPRTDLIIARIEDPQYEGWAKPPDAEAAKRWTYIRPFRIHNVSPATLTAARRGTLDLGYPACALAAVNMPASTAAVEEEFIENLRRMASPRSKTVKLSGAPTAEDALTGAASEGGRIWPDYRPSIAIPPWATKAHPTAFITSMGHRGGNAQGLLTVVMGAFRANNIGFDLDALVTSGQRHTFITGGDWDDIRSIAGTVQEIHVEGRKTEAPTNPGYLVTVAGTQILFDVLFEEDVL